MLENEIENSGTQNGVSAENTDSGNSPVNTEYTPVSAEETNNKEQYTSADAPSGNGAYVHTYGAVYSPSSANGSYSYTPYVNGNAPMGPTTPAAEKISGNTNKKSVSGGKIAIIAVIAVLCILLSGAAAFVGTMLGRTFSAPREQTTEAGGNSLVVPGDTQSPTVKVSHVDGSADVSVETVERGQLMTVPQTVAAVKDSVVEITTETVTQGLGFFSQYVTSGAGSGVVISDNGYIITNNHVIENATSIIVRLTDRKEYKAVLVGTDPEADIAVIRIEPEADHPLVSAVIGNSDKLVVGEDIIVIGNPLGQLGGTVTNGIISATERAVNISGDIMTLIQTNAAVNPGNSGGGMFNLYGELVGVINSKSSGDNVEGLGFAVPVNTAWAVAEELIEYGYVRGKPTLDVTLIDVTNSSYARFYFNSYNVGVYVYEASESSGFKYGDRIVSFNGAEIGSAAEFSAAMKNCSVGDTVQITVMRSGKSVVVNATLSEKVPKHPSDQR